MISSRIVKRVSLQEIQFRLRQELWNWFRWKHSPKLPEGVLEKASYQDWLPSAEFGFEALRGSNFEQWVISLADQILAGRIPIFGRVVEVGEEVDWHRDYFHHRRAPVKFSRRIRYLDFEEVGDHKVVWELNRHSHLVVVALAYGFRRREAYLDLIERHLSSWIAANPFLMGVNWCSALEVGFRVLNWLWVLHFVNEEARLRLLKMLITPIYEHGAYLEHNLSYYFSPNTHLLGEAVALHAVACCFPVFSESARWREVSRRVVLEAMEEQVNPDGSHFEGSSYYHLYALDMFLLHHLVEPCPPSYTERLVAMGEYLRSLVGPSGYLPMVGDEDGGRLFLPFGERRRFGLATLATLGALFDRPDWIHSPDALAEQAVWWLGSQGWPKEGQWARRTVARLYSDAGLAVMGSGETHVLVRVGGIARGSGGHSHADALSLIVRRGDEEVLIDPGTYSYSDARWRELFRGNVAHNTVRINGQNQARPASAFLWKERPLVRLLGWTSAKTVQQVVAECSYQIRQLEGILHRRHVVWVQTGRYHRGLLFIADEITGSEQQICRIEQFWHCGGAVEAKRKNVFELGAGCSLFLDPSMDSELITDKGIGWASPVYGDKVATTVIQARLRRRLPVWLWSVVDVTDERGIGELQHLPGTEVGCLFRRGTYQWKLTLERPGVFTVTQLNVSTKLERRYGVYGRPIRRVLVARPFGKQGGTGLRQGQEQPAASDAVSGGEVRASSE